MPALPITFACGLYDRMLTLHTGDVKPDGIDLNFVVIDNPREIFDRMTGRLEFDVCEMSSSEYISRFAAKKLPFVALPVFASRVFRHGFIVVNRRRRIFPIMHLIVIRKDLYERHPFVATSLHRAFAAAKDWAWQKMRYPGTLRYMLPWLAADIAEVDTLFGGDCWPYGIEPNRATLEALVAYMVEQGLIAAPVPLEELFVPTYG